MLFDIRMEVTWQKKVAIGVYNSFCDCIDYVYAYCKGKK
jgi:hypothetical protein